MKAFLLHGAVSVLTASAALAAYDHWVVRPALRVGIVDVGEVYRQKEAEFTLILTRAASEGERDEQETGRVPVRHRAARLLRAARHCKASCRSAGRCGHGCARRGSNGAGMGHVPRSRLCSHRSPNPAVHEDEHDERRHAMASQLHSPSIPRRSGRCEWVS